jgi:aspartate 1-decarboxylase
MRNTECLSTFATRAVLRLLDDYRNHPEYMLIEVFKSKIHRVRVTQADLNYIGSITIDEELMEAANIVEGEKLQIVNNNNGERFETYAIRGERGSGVICLNGAAARRVQVGDIVILISYCLITPEEAKQFKPVAIFPDEHNRLVKG